MEYRVLVTPPGSGSTHLIYQLKAHARPDLVFEPFSNYTVGGTFNNTGLKITDKPIKEHGIKFLERAYREFNLDINLTIEQNLVKYIDFMQIRSKRRAAFCGTISTLGPQFFRRNKTNGVLAIIRHPLHSMISWLSHQHPSHGLQLGGINSERCVEFFAGRWNRLTADLIAGKIKIIRFEYAAEDSKDIKDQHLKSLFKNWLSSLRNFDELKPKWESLLKYLVEKNYNKIYEKWEI